jgi:hypothetical protein
LLQLCSSFRPLSFSTSRLGRTAAATLFETLESKPLKSEYPPFVKHIQGPDFKAQTWSQHEVDARIAAARAMGGTSGNGIPADDQVSTERSNPTPPCPHR